MAPPQSTVVSPAVALIIRVVTLIALIISLIIISTNAATADAGVAQVRIRFNDFYAYRYMLATAVIGMVYTLLQIAFTLFFVTTGNRLGGDGLALLDFYADKVVSYMLATGAAAGFGLTVDINRLPGNDSATQSFLSRANAAASILFIGFIFSAISSIFSSLSLPKSTSLAV